MTDEELAALFKPMKQPAAPTYDALDPQKLVIKLHEDGFTRMRFKHTAQLVVKYKIETRKVPSWLRKSSESHTHKGVNYEGDLWAKRWFVLLVECEPCNPDAREQCLERLERGDTELQAALEALTALTSKPDRVASFVMEQWKP